MFMMLFISMIFFTMMFIFMNHPLSLGLILLIQTILIALFTGSLTMTYWFSYMIFLIMIGGMLVLFMYMTSVASNEKFKFNMKISFMFLLFFLINMIIFLKNPFYFNLKLKIIDNIEFSTELIFSNQLNKYINWPLMNNFIMIIMYLLITLIMVVKITNINYGPLRQKF